MTDQEPHPEKRETTAERVRRVAGASLKAESPNRWLLMVALTLIFLLLIILGIGLMVAMGARGIFWHHTDQIERVTPDDR